MKNDRAIEGEAAAFVIQRRKEGATVEAITRELGQRFTLECSERTVRRLLKKHGVAAVPRPRRFVDPAMAVLRSTLADTATEAPSCPSAASTPPEVTTPRREPAGAPFGERAKLVAMIGQLEDDLSLPIAPVDRAVLARTIAGLAKRVADIDAAAIKAKQDGNVADADSAWVAKRLAHFADMKRRAQEAVLRTLSPSEQAAARRVLAADSYVAEVADNEVEGAREAV